MTDKDGYNVWLNYEPLPDAVIREYRRFFSCATVIACGDDREILLSAAEELARALPCMFRCPVDVTPAESADGVPGSTPALVAACYENLPPALRNDVDSASVLSGDGYYIAARAADGNTGIVITSRNARGVLYGVFAFLRFMQCCRDLAQLPLTSQPKLRWRMLNHWDNLDGSIERGYAGLSLWKWDELPQTVDGRYTDYARICASVGLNAAVLNNVNTQPQILCEEYIAKVAAIAGVLRRYGITVFLSVNFGSPISVGGLATADPLDSAVVDWWKKTAATVYRLIPDFGGFLVKADSEGQAGPFAYGRTHADGANMLADVLAPHGGICIWRAFVYGHGENDRAKKAYDNFKPLDGSFRKNAAVQIKNGAIDFQPREPVHPLFGALEKTAVFMEFQIAQEYLGQGNHLVYLAPMWKEILEFDTYAHGRGTPVSRLLSGIAGVANTGSDRSWCGSLFHPANWFAFGRLAWDCDADPAEIAREWALCTWGHDPAVLKAVLFILLHSWNACVDYMTPLGLHHIMRFNHHYGPDPACDEGSREDWKPRYYHRADAAGLGFDRTRNGSGAVDQYPPPLADLFNNIAACPEKYLLWFHHVPWTHILSSGRTLKDELVYRYNRGVSGADALQQAWLAVKDAVDPERFRLVAEKLAVQTADAREWRDVCVPYFLSFCTAPCRNIFVECGYTPAAVAAKIKAAWDDIFSADSPNRFYFDADNGTGYLTDTGNNDVRSEGMSYGMMMAVQMDRKDIFDRIWKWSRTYMYIPDGAQKGFFSWSHDITGAQNYRGAAPDGEEYFALALIFAGHRWGNGSGIFNYEQEARHILSCCIKNEQPIFGADDYLIKFVPGCSYTDPSYHLPHFYQLFAKYAAPEDRPFYERAAAASRRFILKSCHPVTGLAPEYAYTDGTPNPDGPPAGHGDFYSDSYRVAANLGLYAAWCGYYKPFTDIAVKIQKFFDGIAPQDYMTYKIDGTPLEQPALHPVGLLATLAQTSAAILADPGVSGEDRVRAQAYVRMFWDTPLRTGERRYYDNCLYFFALLALSGTYMMY